MTFRCPTCEKEVPPEEMQYVGEGKEARAIYHEADNLVCVMYRGDCGLCYTRFLQDVIRDPKGFRKILDSKYRLTSEPLSPL